MLKHAIYALTILTVSATLVVAEQSVFTLDGKNYTGKILSMDAKKLQVKTDKKQIAVPIDQLAEIKFGKVVDLSKKLNYKFMQTFAGDWIRVKDETLADEKISLNSPLVGTVNLKLKDMKILVNTNQKFSASEVIAELKRLKYKNRSSDMVIIKNKKGKWKGIRCALTEFNSEKVRFIYKRKKKAAKSKIVIATYMREPIAKLPASAGFVSLTDGSIIRFKTVEITAENVIAETVCLGKLTIDRKSVASIKFASDKIVSLSELKPDVVKLSSLFDSALPYRVDKSSTGKPIMLAGKTYSKGLGVHSYTELSWDIKGDYITFASLVGIDDNASANGNAVVEILGDGKVLKTLKLAAKSKPVLLSLDIKGVQKLTIRVSMGADKLPIGDHVSFANARLIKS